MAKIVSEMVGKELGESQYFPWSKLEEILPSNLETSIIKIIISKGRWFSKGI